MIEKNLINVHNLNGFYMKFLYIFTLRNAQIEKGFVKNKKKKEFYDVIYACVCPRIDHK